MHLAKYSAHMALAHAQVRGQAGQGGGLAFGHLPRDPVCPGVGQRARTVTQRPARRQLRAAAQARPEPRLLSRGRVAIKAAVGPLGQPHPAHRPAVNAGAGDPCKQLAVKARVVRAPSQVGLLVAQACGACRGGEGGGGGGHVSDVRRRAARWLAVLGHGVVRGVYAGLVSMSTAARMWRSFFSRFTRTKTTIKFKYLFINIFI